jgi:hypothetical protein
MLSRENERRPGDDDQRQQGKRPTCESKQSQQSGRHEARSPVIKAANEIKAKIDEALLSGSKHAPRNDYPWPFPGTETTQQSGMDAAY